MKSRSFQTFVAVLLLVVCMPALTGCDNCCCVYLWGGVAALIAAGAGLIGGADDIVAAICDIVDIPGLCDDAAE